jgi:cytochrome c oxidase subunit 2
MAADAGPGSAAGGPAAEGQTLVAAKCTVCHVIPGSGGTAVGPNLAGVASRPKIAGGAVDNTGPEDLKRWIMDPPALKPGTGMPNLNLTEDEATKIAAFLATLK